MNEFNYDNNDIDVKKTFLIPDLKFKYLLN